MGLRSVATDVSFVSALDYDYFLIASATNYVNYRKSKSTDETVFRRYFASRVIKKKSAFRFSVALSLARLSPLTFIISTGKKISRK